MVGHNPKPNVSDGVITALAVAVIGAPEVFGPHIPHTIGVAMFWGGIGAAILYAVWRWGAWLLGLTRGDEPRHGIDNRGGVFTGRDNLGPITVINAPNGLVHPLPPPPFAGTLFSASEASGVVMVQFGPNGPTFGSRGADYQWNDGPSKFALPWLKESHLIIERIDGQNKVSTEIHDPTGALVATLHQNEWQTAVPPQIFDRNFSAEALEVIDSFGRVILQVKILPDRVQILGEWWDSDGRGLRIAGKGPEVAMVMLSRDVNPAAPKIERLFKYPSSAHLGELAE